MTHTALAGVAMSLLAGCEAQVKTAGLTSSSAASTTDHGSSWDLTTAFPGSGTYSGISSALTASDVCSTKNFLGIPGTANCSGGGSIASVMASSALRSDNATINLMSQVAVDARVPASLAVEGAGRARFRANTARVPDPPR